MIMFCTNCGAQSPDGAYACSNCGVKFGAAESYTQPEYAQQVYAQPEYTQTADPQPGYAQPVSLQYTAAPDNSAYSKRRKSSGCMIVLAVLLAIICIPTACTGCMLSCAACLPSEDLITEPEIEGRWYYYDSEQYMRISFSADEDTEYVVDSDRLSTAVFGQPGARMFINDVTYECDYYSTATLTAMLDGEEVSFIVYFNELMLTLEHPEIGRLTLCRTEGYDNNVLRSALSNTVWSDSELSIAFYDDMTGAYVFNRDPLAFDWDVYGDYLVIYMPESDTHVIWHADYDADFDMLTLERFQESSEEDTAGIVWSSQTFHRD